MDAIVIAALYQFKVVLDAAALQTALKTLCKEQGLSLIHISEPTRPY